MIKQNLICMLILISLTISACKQKKKNNRSVSKDLTETKFILTNGVHYWKETGNEVDGKITEHYKTGEKKFEGYCEKGLLNGKVTWWKSK